MYLLKHKLCIVLFILPLIGRSQNDSNEFLKRLPSDSSKQKLNMDAVYNRPFLSVGKLPVAIGGYLEANSQFSQTDGINDGLSFQFRRFTIFMSSTIAPRLRFFSELEFEDGTKEINIEFAALDMEFHPMLNLRGGIILNPIGAFNQNHDGPRWDFIDRPLVSTTIIPSTLSNAGFGLHGKYYRNRWIIGYEAYLSNGFDDRIISNEDDRTSLAAGKINPSRFEENNSGLPTYTGKLAIRNRKIGELGLSYLTGVYNKWRSDGVIVDSKRNASIMAVDFNAALFKNRVTITAEAAKVMVDVPDTYTEQFGSEQYGFFTDVVATVLERKMFGWNNAKLNLGVRYEFVDYNKGRFKSTNGAIADEKSAIVPMIAFRATGTTVLRFNYRYERQTDLLGNPPARTGIMQFGLSTYF